MIEFELEKSLLSANVPLSAHSTMRVGGNAQYFFELADEGELGYILARCRDFGIPVCLLGAGSNVLFSDVGFEGAAVHFGRNFSKVEREGGLVRAQAGKSLPVLCRELRELGLSGLEFACGIPASVGGGTVGNCGAFGGTLGDRIVSVEFFEKKPERLPASACAFGYRDSFFKQNPQLAVTAVTFRLDSSEPRLVAERMEEATRARTASQNVGFPSLGSVFLREDGVIPAKLIDACGLKGLRVGGAAVSEKHAGFIVNLGGATSENILELIRRIKSTVRQKYGIILHEEIHKV